MNSHLDVDNQNLAEIIPNMQRLNPGYLWMGSLFYFFNWLSSYLLFLFKFKKSLKRKYQSVKIIFTCYKNQYFKTIFFLEDIFVLFIQVLVELSLVLLYMLSCIMLKYVSAIKLKRTITLLYSKHHINFHIVSFLVASFKMLQWPSIL